MEADGRALFEFNAWRRTNECRLNVKSRRMRIPHADERLPLVYIDRRDGLGLR